MKYTKPALSIQQQIDLLASRGMVFNEQKSAERHLGHLNYYRLSGYWRRYQQSGNSHLFLPGTTFDQVISDYTFDRKLKILMLDAIEKLEISIRTRWAHELGLRHGAHAHLDGVLFKARSQRWNHRLAVTYFVRTVEQSKEEFIHHLNNTYDELLPPVWAIVESSSLGQISRWFSNLRQANDRKAIASAYQVDEQLLSSFLHHLSVARNICAHHARLWDRKMSLKARLPRKNPTDLVQSLNHLHRECVYNTLTLMAWLVSRIDPTDNWIKKVKDHVLNHPPACAEMGFPANFEQNPVWKDRSHT